jgi:hypothetical protein
MPNYSWTYGNGYGYNNSALKPPPSTLTEPQSGACVAGYTGDPSLCFYAPAVEPISSTSGLCTNGGGSIGPAYGWGAVQVLHTPQAPCAFACHNDAGGNDYYGLARSLTPKVTLRLDVVHQAAATVIQTLKSEQDMPNQFAVGVYEFNANLSQVYPAVGQGEAGTDLTAAINAVNALVPPITINVPNTYFASSVATLVAGLKPAGNGQSQAAPTKNIFIVTDGMADYNNATGQVLGAMTSATNEQTCQQFKNLGFNVYVLYTPYLAVPNPFYLNNVAASVTPLANSAVTQAMQACATSPAFFFQASDPTAINTAMQAMLASALNTPGRLSQ